MGGVKNWCLDEYKCIVCGNKFTPWAVYEETGYSVPIEQNPKCSEKCNKEFNKVMDEMPLH